MPCKPLVGMNADYRSATRERSAYCSLWAGYFDSILQAGGIPIIVPPITEERDLVCVLDKLDGFMLVGGPDLDPRRDGFVRHVSVRVMESRREDSDRLLARLIVDRHMPVFGIGVGMQLLNVASGGNLMLHIPEFRPGALPHKDRQDPNHRHGLEVVMGSLMERIYGDGEIRVNSMHHMAVDDVAPGFIATARCPDGIIEAIESEIDGWFALGTQFHPESDSATALDARVFEEFLCAITGRVPEVRMVA